MITKDINKVGKVNFHEDFKQDVFEYRHNKFSQLIPKDSIVLDIGAHVGGFSVVFGSCVGEKGKVLSFEPNPKTYNVLKENSKNNPNFNIIPHNFASTLETKDYIFHYTDPNQFGNGMNGGNCNDIEYGESIKDAYCKIPINVKGINTYDFLKENYLNELNKIKFIKTDTEGSDKEVLKTLAPLIKANKPVLMLEAFSNSSNNEIKDYYNTIKSFNYEIYDMSPLDNITDCVGPLTSEEFVHYTKKVIDNGNLFCIHESEIDKYNLSKIIPGKTAAVIFGRNDGYKEPERFKIHLNTMLDTFDEVIYIDWNSPQQSFLYEVIDDLPKTGRLKHYVIPPKYADILNGNDPNAQPCSTVLSFNIGLRRTDAEWVVLATTDIIPPSKEILNNFLTLKANKSSLYTFSRRDIEYDDVINNLNDLDKYRKHLDNTTEERRFPAKVTPNDEWSLFNCCGDFQLATRNIWHKIRGYEEGMPYACFVDTNAQKKATLYGFDLIPVYDIPLYHMSHKGMGNDGSSPSKNVYNDAWKWVEEFGRYDINDHIMYSRNLDTWGFSPIEIEYETI
tara:strand:+ start:9819 stop:11504 length:1686 start_codon:yes stop_codon:yes gene_type:complete